MLKYYEFINENLVKCKVMNNQGAYLVLPSTFAYKEVLIMIHLKDRCDFFISFAKKNATRTFVSIPRVYTGSKKVLQILVRPNNVKTKSIMDYRIIEDERKQEFLERIKAKRVPLEVLAFFDNP